MELKGRAALVTGGGSGIGAASAKELARRGAHVLVADVDADGGRRTADEVGGRFIHLDVSDPASWNAIDEEPELVHLNAGVKTGRIPVRPDELTADAWERIRSVNIDGVALGVTRFLPGMLQRGRGSFCTTASMSGLAAFAGEPFYAASKHLSIGLMRSLGSMFAGTGITFNAVCPDATATGMTSERERARWSDTLLSAEEVALVVVDRLVGQTTGDAWIVVRGREVAPYQFRGVPGSPVSRSLSEMGKGA